MNFPDIPDSIERGAFYALITSLGFESLDNVCSLQFRPDGIYAELLVRDEGGACIDTATGEMLAHKIYIPIR